MELDEAIEYEEEMAEINQAIAYNTNDDNWMDIAQCEKCAKEHRQLAEWLKELKRLKEREPCGDCISREAMLEVQIKYAEHIGATKFWQIRDDIRALPPVTPQPKIGHWVMKHRTHNSVKHYTGQDDMGETHTISVLERYEVDEPYCSECGALAGDTSQDYCCACGARMEEDV